MRLLTTCVALEIMRLRDEQAREHAQARHNARLMRTASSAARSAIELVVEPSPEPFTVTADVTRLKQCLLNFGSNAIKYGRKEGHVRFRAAPHDDRVRIAVSDDGIGIPADKQAGVFQPFNRAGQELGSIEGTGIGLAITKRLVELMNGRVGFSSQPAEGSEFWIELPVHASL